ncbi:PhnD/SsuA/transferrin family substrate-binding protein [uncultured Helicobacter sp.]|uniref:phosphate/phosphite/phosphonate ABC transporter substrate-binding protein n=1 Tax=uncultured Helicobacter sp. TaxID=175537 RepID=UPI00261AAEA6|nr:PhnD/SsuA/transferrin family substrate-binding protein [uncultured Helicobacter sp.]
MQTLLLGAVAYDPKVVPIWDIIRDYANENAKTFGIKLDYVLFSNYERQVDALLKGHIDIAWNTNVAWIRTLHATGGKASALVMRDTDIDFTTKFVCKKGSGIQNLADLVGKRFGLGSMDSAQAAIMPLYYLQKEQGGLDSQLSIVRYNSDVGKHGDTGRSEFDLLKAIKKGELDAGSIGSSTWIRILEEGSYPDIESFWSSPGYCHCNFSILSDFDSSLADSFSQMLLSQNTQKDNPVIAKMMQMEGLNTWVKVGEREFRAYDDIYQAMQEQNLLENNL